jgi:hypothetical protein
MTKILKCKEILDAMIFLNIPTENFLKLKIELGGLDNLYEFIFNKLIIR